MNLDLLEKYGEKWKWLVLSVIYWAIAFCNFPRDFLDLGGDSAQYIIVAESLANGHGYRMLNYPGDPVCTLYPPVFPLLLSSVIKFFGRNFLIMHFLVALFGFFCLFFLYQLFKKYSGTRLAFLTVFFVSLNWSYLAYSSRYILSEIPYIFFSSFTLWILSRYIEKDSYFNFEGALLICGLCLSYFTRSIGLVLFFSVILILCLTRNRTRMKKIILISAGFLPLFFAWNIFKAFYRAYVVSQFKLIFFLDIYNPDLGTIFNHPGYFFNRLSESLSYYAGMIPQLLLGYLSGARGLTGYFIILFFTGLILLGLWQKARENKNCVFNYYFLSYFLLMIFWPAWEGPRFILPVLPFLIFYLFAGLRKLLSFLSRKVYLAAFSAAIGVFFIFNLFSLGAFFRQSLTGGLPVELDNFVAVHLWIKDNLPDKEVILSRKPTVTYFFTNHKAIIYPYANNPEQIWGEVKKNKVRYIIVDEFSRETYNYLSPVLYKYKDKLKLLFRIGETGLFEVKQEN